MNKLGIIVICYNNHHIFLKQIERIKKHCKDDFEIIVVDNSTSIETIKFIESWCLKLKIKRIKTEASSRNGSASHCFSAQYSYTQLRENYDLFLYLDHDCFPIKDFSVKEILNDKYLIAGIGQEKSKTYLWPGCLMFKKGLDVDFSTNHELGLDTGGNIYKIIEEFPDKILYFDEVHTQNPEFTKTMYNFYALINQGMFLHFVNGSGWNNVGHHQERINSLLNILAKS